MSDLKQWMEPFAASIHAKKRALTGAAPKSYEWRRLRESISDDIKKASDFHPREVSVAAYETACRLGVEDIIKRTWHDQKKFDKGRETFLVEHLMPVSMLRERCIAAKSRAAILDVMLKEVRMVWILKKEDAKLSKLGFRSKRPLDAYDLAGIAIHKPAGRKR